MPLEYSDVMRLRLDSHIIFYDEEAFELVDMFAVKGRHLPSRNRE